MISKTVFPFHPSKNKLIIKIKTVDFYNGTFSRDKVKNDINIICEKYGLDDISNSFCRIPNKELREEFKKSGPDSSFFIHYILSHPAYLQEQYVVLQKKNGLFNDSISVELNEIRKTEWGKLSGPLLSYESLKESRDEFMIYFYSNLFELPGLTLKYQKELQAIHIKEHQYKLDDEASLNSVWKMYQFHITKNITYEMSNITH